MCRVLQEKGEGGDSCFPKQHVQARPPNNGSQSQHFNIENHRILSKCWHSTAQLPYELRSHCLHSDSASVPAPAPALSPPNPHPHPCVPSFPFSPLTPFSSTPLDCYWLSTGIHILTCSNKKTPWVSPILVCPTGNCSVSLPSATSLRSCWGPGRASNLPAWLRHQLWSEV